MSILLFNKAAKLGGLFISMSIYTVKTVCHMQEWLLFLASCLSYLPWKNLNMGIRESSITFLTFEIFCFWQKKPRPR